MPLSDKRQAFVNEYEINGHNATQAYKTAYPGCKSGHKQAGQRLLTFVDVKQAMGRLRAKTAKKQAVDRQYCIDKLQHIVENSTTERNQLTALSLLGDFTGAKRDKAPNTEKIAEMVALMSDEEIQTRRIVAMIRTDELSDTPEPALRLSKESA